MKSNKKIYVDHKLIRNDINFDKKTNIKSLFDLDDKNNIIQPVFVEKVKIEKNELETKNDFLEFDNDLINESNESIDNSIEESKIVEKEVNVFSNKENIIPTLSINIDNKSIVEDKFDTNNIENENNDLIENNIENWNENINNENYNLDLVENNIENQNKKQKTKRNKVLPWMLATTSFLLAGTTVATIVLSVLPSDGFFQTQNNTIDKDINFELKHDRLANLNETNKLLNVEFNNTNIDMDKYFFGMNLENKNNFKFDLEEKNTLLKNINNIFKKDKINFLYNVADAIVLNIKNQIDWNNYGINAISSAKPLINSEILQYKTSDIFTIKGVSQMELTYSLNSQTSLYNQSSNINLYSIKFKEASNINEKSYIEITNKTDKDNPIIEIREITDIYSEYLLLNEYANRNGKKSYLSVNPFLTNSINILDDYTKLPNELTKYNKYANVGYFYQFIQNNSLSLDENGIKSIFDSNNSLIDNNIKNNVNELSKIIFKDSNEIKNIFMFLGIEDLLKNNRNISSLKINDIKLSNFVSLSNGKSNKISGSLFTNITYKTDSNIEMNYYSYIFIKPQIINENLTLKYHITTSQDNNNFSSFVEKNWNIQWTPFEILLQTESIKNKNINKPISLIDKINKMMTIADEPSFDMLWRFLYGSGFINFVEQNPINKNMYQFNKWGLQHKMTIKNLLFDEPNKFDDVSWENRIQTYWLYYFLDEINSIDETKGQNVKPFSAKNPFIKNVTIDSINWSGLLFDKANKNSLNYEFEITYSYVENNKKMIVNKKVFASGDDFNNENFINHYLPTVTIKETITSDNVKINDSISFNEKMDVSANIESFVIKATKRLMN